MRARAAALAVSALLAAVPALHAAGGDGAPAPQDPAVRSETRWMPWVNWMIPGKGHKAVRFPLGDLFAPPLADQKQPRFAASWQRYSTGFGSYSIGSVAFGENIGLVRWPGRREGEGWQLGVSGGVFAIFNMDSASHDLLNADYVIGFPLSFRSGRWSARARLYHQSSHLGDEFLLTSQPIALTRINLSFETLEALASWDCKGFRLYGGPSRILTSYTPLDRNRVQFGGEYIGARELLFGGKGLAGAEWSAWDETAWRGNISLKAGLLFASPYQEARSIRLMAEYYDGLIPHGQFYKLHTRYAGFGFAFSL